MDLDLSVRPESILGKPDRKNKAVLVFSVLSLSISLTIGIGPMCLARNTFQHHLLLQLPLAIVKFASLTSLAQDQSTLLMPLSKY